MSCHGRVKMRPWSAMRLQTATEQEDTPRSLREKETDTPKTDFQWTYLQVPFTNAALPNKLCTTKVASKISK
jgi:hypothetical protein